MGKLDGKVAVVTGAGSGMGRASALLFAAEGAKVVCADVSGHEESAAAEIGKDAIAVRADVSQASDVQAMFAAAVEAFGRLDVVLTIGAYDLMAIACNTFGLELDPGLAGFPPEDEPGH